jgi:hypothetical protein
MINDSLAQTNLSNRQLAKHCEEIRSELEESKELMRRQEARLKKQAADLASLKVGRHRLHWLKRTDMLSDRE